MSDPESFDEWKERTAPSPEAVELANAGSLSTYVATALIIAMFPLGPAAKVALLLLLLLRYPTSVLRRRWLRQGHLLTEPPLATLEWVRVALAVGMIFAVSWGHPRDLVLAGAVSLLLLAEARWHVLDRFVDGVGSWLRRIRRALRG